MRASAPRALGQQDGQQAHDKGSLTRARGALGQAGAGRQGGRSIQAHSAEQRKHTAPDGTHIQYQTILYSTMCRTHKVHKGGGGVTQRYIHKQQQYTIREHKPQ